LRGFARDRRAAQLTSADAFILARRADGRLTIEDTSTGRIVDLDGFGPTNRDAFLKLLPSREVRS
jgi:putative photosynthetic complex assembly protein